MLPMPYTLLLYELLPLLFAEVSIQLQQERKRSLSLEKQVLSLRVQVNTLSPLQRLLINSKQSTALPVSQQAGEHIFLSVSSLSSLTSSPSVCLSALWSVCFSVSLSVDSPGAFVSV